MDSCETDRVPEKLNDLELIQRCQTEGPSAFEEIILRYQNRLFSFLCSRMRNQADAQDALQETFLKAYRHLVSFRGENLAPWLFTIARNTAFSFYRGDTIQEELSPTLPSSSPGPAEESESRDQQDRIWQLARELKAQEFEVLWLRYAEHLDLPAVAEIMGISEVNTRVLLFRARKKLGKKLSLNR
ncbi:MAG: sigma-70 family RNA polymerase sigma factor [Verrucomicrobiota bacterium]|nr:sigma-70 family RNA polymerase sigma factor [Verrucomicrobiota bacterium]